MHERIPNSRSPSSLIGKWAVTAAGETEVGPMDGFGWGHQQWDQAMGPVLDANANTARRETRPQPASQIAIQIASQPITLQMDTFSSPRLDQPGPSRLADSGSDVGGSVPSN